MQTMPTSNADRRCHGIRRGSRLHGPLLLLACLCVSAIVSAQQAKETPAKATAPQPGATPQLVDITAKTGIRFNHMSTPEARYIVESMSGGVALIDYDQDGYPDIYFTNAASVEMALAGKKAKSALYHNNRD